MKVIIFDNKSVKCTCGGCPTVYEFKDVEGNEYYFRLRHGYWYVESETSERTVCEGKSYEFDGCCSWEDAIKMINKECKMIGMREEI